MTVPVLREELLLVTTPSHPLARRRKVAPRDLAGEPFVLFEMGSATRKVMWSSAVVFQPVAGKIGGTSAVLQAGVPKVSMQRPWADRVRGAPSAAIPRASSAVRREMVMACALYRAGLPSAAEPTWRQASPACRPCTSTWSLR